jgi:hypothetical protein
VDPVAETGLRDPEVGRDLGDRLLSQPGQLDGSLTELRRVRTEPYGLLSKTIIALDQVSGKVGQALTQWTSSFSFEYFLRVLEAKKMTSRRVVEKRSSV